MSVVSLSPAGNRQQRLPVDEVCEIIEADYWNGDEPRAMDAVRNLSQPAMALIGQMFRHWAIHEDEPGYCGTVGALSSLFDMGVAYALYGEDQEIAARFRDLADETKHPEAVRKMADQEADQWRAVGDFAMAADVLREWGFEPAAPEELNV